MRFARALRQERQPFFLLAHKAQSSQEKKLTLNLKRQLNCLNPWILKDAKTIRAVFHDNGQLQEARIELGRRVTDALSELQDSHSFRIEDVTLDQIFKRNTGISHPIELAIIDLTNPRGIPPEGKSPPIHDPSLVAEALLKAGFTGSFLIPRLQDPKPWPMYEHLPQGGYIYPPRLCIDAGEDLGRVTLTLPSPCVLPLYDMLRWFHMKNRNFRELYEVFFLWARSHGLPINVQTAALMVLSAVQTAKPLFEEDSAAETSWVPLECRDSVSVPWQRTSGLISVNFRRVPTLQGVTDNVILNFFRHWADRVAKESLDFAFTVRRGLEHQLIPRRYNRVIRPETLCFENTEDPTSNFLPWTAARLVVQDPFIVTHNHAECFTVSDVLKLAKELRKTANLLFNDCPLPWTFGTQLAPPESATEAKILSNLGSFSSAINLVERDRVPENVYKRLTHSPGFIPLDLIAELDNGSAPELIPMTYPDPRLQFSRRHYHASSIRSGSSDNLMVPPEPLQPQRNVNASERFRHKRPLEFGESSDCAQPVRTTAADPASGRIHRSAALDSGVPESVTASRSQTVSAVDKAIQKRYGKGYVVDTFGSTRYGISTASSDLDLVVLDLQREHGFTDPPDALPAIYNIRNLALTLKRAGFKILDIVASASVPIVKFRDPRTGHVCDINVNDRLGLLNSDLIRRYCQLNPVLGDMIRYIKRWAKPLGLNSPSPTPKQPVTFSSYALVIMTVGFLQHRGLLPNLQEGLPPLEEDRPDGTFWLRRPMMCCDVRYDLVEDWAPPREVPMHELMCDWFRFWASEFNYDQHMICIRRGGCFSRSADDVRGLMWIMDPFIRSKNITQSLGRKSIQRFKVDCLRYSIMPEFERGLLPPLGSTTWRKNAPPLS